MKNRTRTLVTGWILLLGIIAAAGAPALASVIGPAVEDGQEDMDLFFKAKELVFRRDWPAARVGFESYLKDFPEGRLRDEAHYWLAQSLNSLARDAKGRDAALRLKKAALDEIRKLVDAHPGSLWRDDALALRIEISSELFLLGEEEYRSYIIEAVETGGRSARDLKIQALGALVNLDPGLALPVLRRTLETDDDVAVRARCLALLLRLPAPDAEKLLEKAARSDRAESIRSEAARLLDRLRQSRLPVKLRYYIYGSRILDDSLLARIPEGEAREFSLDRSAAGNAGAVLDKVKDALGGELSTPLSSASGQLPTTPDFGGTSTMTHRAGDYQIWIKEPELKVASDRITGEIEFRNRSTNEKFDRAFSVDRSADKLIAARVGDKVSLVMFQFAETGSPRASEGAAPESTAGPARASKTSGYGPLKTSSIIALPPGITVRTERMSYDLQSFAKNLIGLEMAKASIVPENGPAPRDPWVLIGDLFYFKDSRKLVGYGAYLIDPAKEVVAEGLIEVPAGDPAAFKVLSGKTYEKGRRTVMALDEKRTRPIFSTLWSNYLDWAVLTTRCSTPSGRDMRKMDFGLSQAARTVDGRDWVLIGQIVALGQDRKFVARQAALLASDGTVVHGAEIHVNADDPADHKVVVKRP